MAAYTVVSINKADMAKKRLPRTISMLCEDEPLSDSQLKSYQTKIQEYRTYLEAMTRLASSGNVSVTEEAVMIGDYGLLTGEALNALQHAGAISVYNTLQQNNWRFPVPDEGEVAILKRHNPPPDEFLDSERPIRADWPAIYLSDCFIECERAKLNGTARPLRTLVPPTISYRNAADIDEEVPEPDVQTTQITSSEGGFEIVSTDTGLMVKRNSKEGKDKELIPLEEYYYGRQEGIADYREEKKEYRFYCSVCNKIFFSNVKLMYHILGHVDEKQQASLNWADLNQCRICMRPFPTPSDLRSHVDLVHPAVSAQAEVPPPPPAQTASQLLMQQQQLAASGARQQQEQQAIPMRPTSCRICGKDFPNEFTLARHLQSNHKQREMPYVCRLCSFRSSLFEDILDHFTKLHGRSNHLLCTYCLRVFTVSDAAVESGGSAPPSAANVGKTQAYLQHLKIHESPNQCRKCPCCRLSFTNKSDYQLHRKLDHKASTTKAVLSKSAADRLENYTVDLDDEDEEGAEAGTAPTRMNAPGVAHVTDMSGLICPDLKEETCMECQFPLASKEHKQYLPCALCRFATCCAQTFTRHVRNSHQLGDTDEDYTDESALSPTKLQRLSELELQETSGLYCTACGQSGLDGNALAQHLVEDCGSAVATSAPDEHLIEMSKMNEEERHQKESILFSAGEEPVTDVHMETESDNQVMVQMGDDETQQYILPPGINLDMLEEGQTLVLMQGEDGQQQYAIVNQQDIVESAAGETMIIQGGDEEQGGMVYYEEMDQGAEDEKENQFA